MLVLVQVMGPVPGLALVQVQMLVPGLALVLELAQAQALEQELEPALVLGLLLRHHMKQAVAL